MSAEETSLTAKIEPIQAQIKSTKDMINKLEGKRYSLAKITVPVIPTGWFGRTTNKNKNAAKA